MFCFLPASFKSSTYTDKNSPCFSVNEKAVPIWNFFPNRISIGFSQIAFPITVRPKDDRADFVQEERLDLPYWTMILAIRVVVDESKCLDIPIFGISNNFGASSFFYLGISRYCVCCLSCAPWQSGHDIHDFCCRHL